MGRVKLLVHRIAAAHFLPNPDGAEMVDHIDNIPTNNHVTNLRWASRQENNRNRVSQRGSTSAFKGVSWHKPRAKWVANYGLDGRQHHIGYFTNERDAARAYNVAVRELHGEFARLNDLGDA